MSQLQKARETRSALVQQLVQREARAAAAIKKEEVDPMAGRAQVGAEAQPRAGSGARKSPNFGGRKAIETTGDHCEPVLLLNGGGGSGRASGVSGGRVSGGGLGGAIVRKLSFQKRKKAPLPETPRPEEPSSLSSSGGGLVSGMVRKLSFGTPVPA